MKRLRSLMLSVFLVGLASSTYAADPQNESELLEARINALKTDIDSGKYGFIDEVLVQSDNKTLLHLKADYDYAKIEKEKSKKEWPWEDAWHPYYRGTEYHTLMSITKSVTSLLIGVLETEGKIPNVGEAKVLDLVGDRYESLRGDANWAALTIQDLLTMRVNMEWDENPNWGWTDDPDRVDAIDVRKNDLVAVADEHDDWVQYVLKKPMNGPSGVDATWYYNSGNIILLSAVIENATGKSAAAYAKEKLFGPMGIKDYQWLGSEIGQTDTQGGLYMKSTDLIKFCSLLKNDGAWRGRQLVSSDYVSRSMYPWTATFGENDVWPPKAYGYAWWLSDPAFPGKMAFLGSGFAGQYLSCLPQEDIAMVTLSYNMPGLDVHYRTAAWEIRKRVNDEILPLLSR